MSTTREVEMRAGELVWQFHERFVGVLAVQRGVFRYELGVYVYIAALCIAAIGIPTVRYSYHSYTPDLNPLPSISTRHAAVFS